MIAALLLVAVASAILTWMIGWWAVLVVGLVAGVMRLQPASIALATALGWAALLAFDAWHGRLGAMATVLGGVLHAPGVVLLLLTLVFAALGAWSTATIGAAVAKRIMSRRAGHSVEGHAE